MKVDMLICHVLFVCCRSSHYCWAFTKSIRPCTEGEVYGLYCRSCLILVILRFWIIKYLYIYVYHYYLLFGNKKMSHLLKYNSHEYPTCKSTITLLLLTKWIINSFSILQTGPFSIDTGILSTFNQQLWLLCQIKLNGTNSGNVSVSWILFLLHKITKLNRPFQWPFSA